MKTSTDSDTRDQDPLSETGSESATRFATFSELATEDDAGGERAIEAPPEANVILISHPGEQGLGRRWHLRSGVAMEIGRSAECDISLPDALSVSRRHAILRFGAGIVELEDLSSTNGSYVNDRSVAGRSRLRSGDRFQVGTVHFKFLQERDVEHAYYETLYQLAMRDGLTETFNRRKFTEELEREFQRAIRYERPLSLILLDLDHFKQVNDEFGHLCGDHVLKELSSRVRRNLRPEQTFARVGGEEFAVLSPETEAEGSLRLAEKIREEIASQPFRFQKWEIAATCSLGVSEMTERMEASEQLFEAADRALYVAKEEGRNRCSLADW
jgi:two-component system cell cycle response regulator